MIPQTTIDSAVKTLFADIKFQKEPAGLYDPLRYMIEIGGKRVRPRLCLTAYGLYKDDFSPEVLEVAAGLEVFHTFTLLHDDIMDHSPLRRGKQTVWQKWNPDVAILSGDVMCIDAYKRIARAPGSVLTEALSLFSKTASEVCDGQQLDMEFEDREKISLDEYMQMIGLKTGVLIACSAAMGGLLGGASKEQQHALYEYGYNLGLAFQLADDYLDVYGNAETFGKPIGGDILNRKKSWLAVRAFEKAPAEMAVCFFADSLAPEERIAAVKAVYDRSGVAQEAQKAIEELTDKAIGHLPSRDEPLVLFANALVGRKF